MNGATISATVTPSAAICGSNIFIGGNAAAPIVGTNSGASALRLLLATTDRCFGGGWLLGMNSAQFGLRFEVFGGCGVGSEATFDILKLLSAS